MIVRSKKPPRPPRPRKIPPHARDRPAGQGVQNKLTPRSNTNPNTTTLTLALGSIDASISDVDKLNNDIVKAMEDTLHATAELNKKGSKPSKPPILKEL